MRRFQEVERGDSLMSLEKGPITREEIIRYAVASGDFNPSHVDEVLTQNAGREGVFAHGMLGTGWLSQLVTDWAENPVLKCLNVRATAIVRPGDTLVCTGQVVEKRVVDGEGLVTIALQAKRTDGVVTHDGYAEVMLPMMEPASLRGNEEPQSPTDARRIVTRWSAIG